MNAQAPGPARTIPEISGARFRLLRSDEASNPDAALELVVVAEPAGDSSAAALERLLAEQRDSLLEVMRDHGNILFRGFEVEPHAFEALVASSFEADRFLWMFPMAPRWARALLDLPIIGRITRAFLGWIESAATGRAIVGEKQSTLADDQTIQFPHHEYGIFFNVPRVLAFFCEKEAEHQGETLLCDARAGYAAMPEPLKAHFEATEYIRYRSENQWYLPPFTAPAVLYHPMDGHPSMNFTAYQHDIFARVATDWFPDHDITATSQDETFSFVPTFHQQGQTSQGLTEDQIVALAESHLRHSVLLRWQKGDLLLMDNFRVVHGRLNAGMPERKVLQIVLCDYVRNTNHFTV